MLLSLIILLVRIEEVLNHFENRSSLSCSQYRSITPTCNFRAPFFYLFIYFYFSLFVLFNQVSADD